MTDQPKGKVPAAVKDIIGAMVHQALARCDRLGIAWEDFYRALLEEQELHSNGNVEDLFERTFRRLKGMAN